MVKNFSIYPVSDYIERIIILYLIFKTPAKKVTFIISEPLLLTLENSSTNRNVLSGKISYFIYNWNFKSIFFCK